VGSTVALGTSIYDTAAVGPVVAGIAITGTVTYRFFANGDCSSAPLASQTLPLGTQSATQGPLHAGSYAFDAVYSGNANYGPSPVSACEHLTVERATPAVTTTLHDAADNAVIAVGSTVALGTSIYDTAAVGPVVAGIPITGSVTYRFFTNAACTGAPLASQTVPVGTQSASQGPLHAGSYAFDAVYNGNANYGPSPVSACEDLTVSQAAATASTTLHNAAGAVIIIPVGSAVPLGTQVFDRATVGPEVDSIPITGDVTFRFFHNDACSGTPAVSENKTVGSPSSIQGPLAAGVYSFDATYLGDHNYAASPVSACEPFSVTTATPTAATQVIDDATGHPADGTESTGASFHDTATLKGVTTPGFPPSGTTTYSFYPVGDCTGTPTTTQTVTVIVSATGAASVPPSSSTGALGAGDYSYHAVYNGNTNYEPVTSACEPFRVARFAATTATVVFDPAADAPWTKTETTGTSAFDTATVTAVPGFTPAGTVTYSLFSSDTCASTDAIKSLNGHTWPQEVTLTATGTVPNSMSTGPLAAGSYSFRAVYSGDANHARADSECEPFAVNQGASSTGTTVFDASTNRAVVGTEKAGTSAYDTSTVTVDPGMTPGGTVTYLFFTNGTCTGTGAAAGTVQLTSAGKVPNSNTQGPLAAGTFSFQTHYSGDANFHGSTGGCEPFTVAAVAPPPTTVAPPAHAASAPPPSNAPSRPLPVTGLAATWYGLTALALLGTGALLVVAARRGRRGRTRPKHRISKA
jgi:hypothetical protein